jgi:pimeloyl-ACP methyl ester carboxylesterase
MTARVSITRSGAAYTPNEASLLIRDMSRPVSNLARLVVMCHGYQMAADSYNPSINAGFRYQWKPFVDAGFAVLVPDCAGSATFGSDAAQTALGAAVTWGLAQPGVKTDKVILFGTSMGTLTALNWARANPTKVAGYVGTLPAANMSDIHDNNRSALATVIEAAYGGASPYGTAKAPTTRP